MLSNVFFRLSLLKEPYFRYLLKSPIYYPSIFLFLVKIIFAKLKKYLLSKRLISLSNKVYNTKNRKIITTYAKRIYIKQISIGLLENLQPFQYSLVPGDYELNDIEITLATRKVKLIENFYDYTYDDKEDYFAANRFIWLYEILLKYPYKNVIQYCLKIIVQWSKENILAEKNMRFESYSISERIISFLFFVKFAKKYIEFNENDYSVISTSIKNQINYLVQNLEYHGSKTNNHILNNARALYIAGRLLKINEIEHLAKKIVWNEIDLIFENGCYLEGSSHYQMLLTKNFLEIVLIAHETKDNEGEKLFGDLVSQMLYNCNILQSKYDSKQYPLFGDISPDMAPEWFIGYPFSLGSKRMSKWASLFIYSKSNMELELSDSHIDFSDTDRFKSKWLYLEDNDFEIWSTLRKGQIPCHGHNDNGSIVLFFRGTPIIIDPGLSNYIYKQEITKLQASALVHNFPLINMFSVDAAKNSILKNLINPSNMYDLKVVKNMVEYKIEYGNKKIIIKRQITIESTYCSIIDSQVNSNKKVDYQITWMFTELPENLSSNIFKVCGLTFEFISNNQMSYQIDEIVGRSTKYGELLPCYRVEIKTKLSKSPFNVLIKSS